MNPLAISDFSSVPEAIGDEIAGAIDRLDKLPPSQIFGSIEHFFEMNGVRILWAAAVYAAGYLSVRLLLRLLKGFLGRSKIDPTQHQFILSTVKYLGYVLVAVVCLGMLGIPLTPLVTTMGIAGLALSLALQDTLGNIAGGISVLFSNPFSKGNFVDIGGIMGTAEEIGLIYTLLRKVDNKHVYLPNGDVAKATIVNYSREELRRVDIYFPVRANADFERVKGLILEVVESAPLAVKGPPPIVRASEVSHALVKIACLVWAKSGDVLDLNAYLIENVRRRLTEEGY